MSLIPDTIDGKIQFFGSKTAPWSTNAVAIGTTAAEVTALTTKVTTAQTKLAAAVAARAASKTATEDLKQAVRDLVLAGSNIIKEIRAKAAVAGPGVYSLAQIPPPAIPGPTPAPGTPESFKAVLNPDGSLGLSWKCPNPVTSAGTIYQIARRTGATGEFNMIGASGLRKFTDATVPAGVASVTYQVQAVRTTAVGVAAQFTVNFGTATDGVMTASVVESAPKLAA